MEMMDEVSPFAILARHQKTIPVDVEAIARDLGIAVRNVPLGKGYAGEIRRDPVRGGTSGFAILVNSDDPYNRRRFTLAHEIAHFILHRELIDSGIIDDTMYRSDLSSFQEVQANKMAADILMPIAKVKAEKARGASIEDLAKRFRVSPAAMKIRYDSIKV